jgi:23S rRNA pseudouridine1911/1915/1917 synthase
MHNETYTAEENHDGLRLDMFLSEISSLTRSKVKRLVNRELILVNNEIAKKSGKVIREGNIVDILPVPTVSADNEPTQDNDTSIYEGIIVIKEEDDYLILHKPSGLLVHPTMANEPVTLTSWLMMKYPDVEGVGEDANRPGIVHRLDRHASGLLVIARNQPMYLHLKKQFQNREIKKKYTVLVHGAIEKNYDTINFDIDRGHDGKMVARPKLKEVKLNTLDDIQEGKESLTEFNVTKRFTRYTLLDVRIHSGRTHQIRVHMYAYAHPVVGDILYFNKNLYRKSDLTLDRMFLHAAKLCFADLNGKEQCFESELPETLSEYLEKLT